MVDVNTALHPKRPRQRLTGADKVFDVINYTLVGIATLVVVYPLIFILSASVSDPNAVYNGQVWLYPVGFTLDGYKVIFQDPTIWRGYANTILYTTTGTALSVILTLMTSFALAQRSFKARNYFMVFFVITMFFSGGIIPLYLVVRDLGMLNTIWAMIIPTAISMWLVIIARTFFQSTIPDELREAAFVEGATYTRFFVSIVLPISKAVIAVLALFYAVAQWNSYFSALIYLQSDAKYPLQLVLRNILILSQSLGNLADPSNAAFAARMARAANLIKYGIIIVASAPLLVAYPFLQKYFVKGVLIGSLKG